MLTALTIKNRESANFFVRLFDSVRGNSVYTSINSARGVALRRIYYINRTGRIDWTRLNKLVGAQRNGILCADNILLPEEMGFRRFNNREFKSRLCVNLGLYIETKLEKKVPVAFYDPNGENVELIKDAALCCPDFTVITDNLTLYNEHCEKLAEETGCSVHCSENRSLLVNAPLVLAPARIVNLLPFSGESVVLTSAPPTVCTPGFVYFDYSFRMPNLFDELKPEELSEEYFAGALYTQAYQRELGSIVPTSCSNLTSAQTAESLREYLGGVKS